MKPVRIGMVGCGGIANAHLEGYRSLAGRGCDHFVLSAVCDVDAARASAFASQIAQFQATPPQVFTDLDALLAARVVDGVDVCTTHADHHPTAIRCLEAGVHVMVEKPMGVTVRAARRMQEVAARTGHILSIAENSRRGLGQRAMAWLFNQDRRLGAPRLFAIDYFAGPPLPLTPPAEETPAAQLNWRLDKLQAGGGWTYDGGVHLMDSLLVYFGPIDTVYAEHRTLTPRETLLTDGRRVTGHGEDTSLATFRFASGLIGRWSFSFALPGVDFMRVGFYCDQGYVLDETPGGWTHTFGGGFIDSQARIRGADGKEISSRDLELEYVLSLSGEERERLFPHGIQRSMAIECHEFVDCIRCQRQPEVDAAAGLAGLAVSAALYESAEAGVAVRIQDVLDGAVDAYQRPIDAHWGLLP